MPLRQPSSVKRKRNPSCPHAETQAGAGISSRGGEKDTGDGARRTNLLDAGSRQSFIDGLEKDVSRLCAFDQLAVHKEHRG